MGSLMAGWDSPVMDPKVVKYERNKSFTRGEIEAYWKSHKTTEEEHADGTFISPKETRENKNKRPGAELLRSNSMPLTDRKDKTLTNSFNAEMDEIRKTNVWWTRSNWAFLNEPPVISVDVPSHRFASKKHITEIGGFKPDIRPGISA